MKKRSILILFFLLNFSLLILLGSCSGKNLVSYKKSSGVIGFNPISKDSFLLGTLCTITLYDKKDDYIFDKAFKRISDLENKMSINIEKSEVIDINYAAGKDAVVVSKDTLNTILKGIEYSKDTDGKFDITIGPLVESWGISTEHPRVPSEDEIRNNIGLISYKNITVNEEKSSVKLDQEGMILDLGGIAKGYVADEVAKLLRAEGVNHAIINLGGNVLVIGDNPKGRPWKVGVQDPFSQNRGDSIGYVEVTDETVTTAGIYERRFKFNGKYYHHILDPSTGYPCENMLAGVTIITQKSVDGDGIDTGIFLMGLEKGLSFVNSRKDVSAIFVTKDKQVFLSDNIKEDFILTNSDYTIHEYQ